MSNEKLYNVFVRNWWRKATEPGWPNDLEPDAGAPKRYKARGLTFAQARKWCEEWNASNEPGKLGRMAEFEAA